MQNWPPWRLECANAHPKCGPEKGPPRGPRRQNPKISCQKSSKCLRYYNGSRIDAWGPHFWRPGIPEKQFLPASPPHFGRPEGCSPSKPQNGQGDFLEIAKGQEGFQEMPRAPIFRGAFWALRASKCPEGPSAPLKYRSPRHFRDPLLCFNDFQEKSLAILGQK